MMEGLLIKNVLSNKERKKLIKDCQPLLKTSGEISNYYNKHLGQRYAGRQTPSNLHEDPKFLKPIVTMMTRIHKETGRNFVVRKSWINWTNGSKKEMMWHDHLRTIPRGGGYTMVYYIKIPVPFFSNGTLFKEEGFITAPQNSILIFPPHLEHTAPTSPFRLDRYTMSLDLFNDPTI
tara:strand:+ start:216 stop:746 length:531 start_codon:yes stop_codon:yes gene_type:complete